MLAGGLRPSEALALRWSDYDQVGGTVRIERSLARWPGEWAFGETKSRAGNRRVPLPRSVVNLIERHRIKQLAEKLRAGPAYTAHDLIFASVRGEPLEHRVLARRHFKQIVAAAGVRMIRPYDLRHTSATLSIDMGTHPRVLADRLGHSDIKMTLGTYQTSLAHHHTAVADDLEAMLYAPIPEGIALPHKPKVPQGRHKLPTMIIDPPVGPYSEKAEIQKWIHELRGIQDHWQVREAIAEAESWLSPSNR
ncbi:MAG: site-specific integrase [Gemmatimonadaceae bacterium]|nr:site-specific integrase [Gemmatimonadaceae bacterium]